MKNIRSILNKQSYRLLLCIIFSSALFSCDLEDVTYDQLSADNFYKTETDYLGASTAIFNAYFQPPWGNFEFTAQWMNVGDDELTSNFAQIAEADHHNIVSTNYFSYVSTWKSLYQSVTAANAMIVNLGQSELTEASKELYEGQARFGRALAYFFLVRWWGDLPLVTENTTVEEMLSIKKSPVAEVYKLIVSDLKRAIEVLPAPGTAGYDRGKPTSGAAKAILAEVYLHMAGWPLKQNEKYADARNLALEVVQSGYYSLESDYHNLWTLEGESSNEYIFQLEAIGLEGFSNHVTDKLPGEEGGWENYICELSYYNSFPEGPRKDQTFHTETADGIPFTEWNIGTPTLGKYIVRDESSISSPSLGQFNIPIIRLAEVMLIYAEAQNMAEEGPNQTSINYLNLLRGRGNAVHTTLTVGDFTQGAFDQAILDEKHWELGFEYNRWFDMTRRELLPADVTKEHYYMPIPSDELAIIDL